MRSFYESNPGFRQYVDRCCQKHECDVEKCFTFSWVKNAYEYYKTAEQKNVSVSEVKAGCGAAMGECK